MIFEIDEFQFKRPTLTKESIIWKHILKKFCLVTKSFYLLEGQIARQITATFGADLNLSWSVDFAHSTLYPCQSTVDHGKIPDEKKHELIPCTSETHERLSVPKSNVKKWWSQKSPKSSESSERSGHKAASISHYAVLRESRYYTSSPPPPPPPLLRVLPPTKWQIVGEG